MTAPILSLLYAALAIIQIFVIGLVAATIGCIGIVLVLAWLDDENGDIEDQP